MNSSTPPTSPPPVKPYRTAINQVFFTPGSSKSSMDASHERLQTAAQGLHTTSDTDSIYSFNSSIRRLPSTMSSNMMREREVSSAMVSAARRIAQDANNIENTTNNNVKNTANHVENITESESDTPAQSNATNTPIADHYRESSPSFENASFPISPRRPLPTPPSRASNPTSHLDATASLQSTPLHPNQNVQPTTTESSTKFAAGQIFIEHHRPHAPPFHYAIAHLSEKKRNRSTSFFKIFKKGENSKGTIESMATDTQQTSLPRASSIRSDMSKESYPEDQASIADDPHLNLKSSIFFPTPSLVMSESSFSSTPTSGLDLLPVHTVVSQPSNTCTKSEQSQIRPKVRGHLKGDSTFAHLMMVQELSITPHDDTTDQSTGYDVCHGLASEGIIKSSSLSKLAQLSLPLSLQSTRHKDKTEKLDILSGTSKLRRTGNSRAFDKDSSAVPVWVLKFSHDGLYLAAGSHDGTVFIWRTASFISDSLNHHNLETDIKLNSFSPNQEFEFAHSTHITPSLAENKLHYAQNILSTDISFQQCEGTLSSLESRKLSSTRKSTDAVSKCTDSFITINSARELASAPNTPRPSCTNQPSKPVFQSLLQTNSGTIQSSTNLANNASPSTYSMDIFEQKAMHVFKGHTQAITAISWSKGGFIVSASMDRTVNLWHINCADSLCVFHHPDIVTSVCFHPHDDRYFLSGALDGRVRLWSIHEKKVKYWNELHRNAISALAFNRDGTTVIVGTVQGDCVFYESEGLKYNTQIQLASTSSLKGSKDVKITGIVALPPQVTDNHQDEKFLVTSTDSHVRILNARDKSLYRKFYGAELKHGHLAAGVSDDGRFIICPSEDKQVIIWDTDPSESNQLQFSGVLGGMKQWQADSSKGTGLERITPSDVPITAAIFAPEALRKLIAKQTHTLNHSLDPSATLLPMQSCSKSASLNNCADQIPNDSTQSSFSTTAAISNDGADIPPNDADGMVVVVSDIHGRVRVYLNRSNLNGVDGSGHASKATLFAPTLTSSAIVAGNMSQMGPKGSPSRLERLRAGIVHGKDIVAKGIATGRAKSNSLLRSEDSFLHRNLDILKHDSSKLE
ncbi:hypothetical protein BDV3_003180 [Batrachochytrium dendrobatidis]